MSATLALPLSAFELREAIRQARPYDPGRLDRVLRLDASRGLVEVQAHAAWTSLLDYLRPGADARAWQGLGSIGESIAANAAGPDGRPCVAHVESLALVTPDGELRRIGREANAPLFALAVGGHGVFGAVYSASLRLESLARAGAEAAAPLTLALPAGGGARRALELLLPPERLEAFLAEARARCAQWRIAIAGVEARRTAAEAETCLRWARREYAAVRLALAQPPALGGAVRATQLARELIDSAIAHGGSFPIAATPQATRAQVEACYPMMREFLAEKRRLDPGERLANAWYRHHRSLLGREGCAVRWSR